MSQHPETRTEASAPVTQSKLLQMRPVDLPSELSRLREENRRLKEELDRVLISRSWRMTAPLRVVRLMVRGEWGAVRQSCIWGVKKCYYKIPVSLRARAGQRYRQVWGYFSTRGYSRMNQPAVQAIVDRRNALAQGSLRGPVVAQKPTEWPEIDISVVCYNSRKWLDGFMKSLSAQSYPLDRIHLYFVDNGSSDDTVAILEGIKAEWRKAFASLEILNRPNKGFGAGHNAGIQAGRSSYCLVTNADLTFDQESLTRIVATACSDGAEVACWELRQKPYEHPKFYDPVTGETNWCSHACVLLRRTAFEAIGGYDENIFMYGEDVELSYRLRQHGFRLRYCPEAVVWHYTYEHENQVKPLQFTGSIFANLYLRLKYGTWGDIASIAILLLKLWETPEVYPGSRKDLVKSLKRLRELAPGTLRQRKKSAALFPFHQWDYELARHGAFVAASEESDERPLVSIITRTYRGRATYLRQAILSVYRQTYPRIEHIIVEDGGETLRGLVEELGKELGTTINYLALGKVGRSVTGNAGLAAARGEFVLFLDDDDLLFSDHVEFLIKAMQDNPGAAAAYSLAWEVPTDASRIADGSYTERAPILHRAMQQPFDHEVLREYNYIPIQSIMFRRELYLERGGFEEDLEALEDWNLWNRYAVGYRFVYVPKVTSLYRTPADPAVAKQRSQVLRDAYESVLARNASAVQMIENSLHG